MNNLTKMITTGYLTLYSNESTNLFRYEIKQCEDNKDLYFVGIHNDMIKVKYINIGFFNIKTKTFRVGKKADTNLYEKEINAFSWCFNNIEELELFTKLKFSFKRSL